MSTTDTFTTDAAEINAVIAMLESLAITREDNLDLSQTWVLLTRESGLTRPEFRGGKFYKVYIKSRIREPHSVEETLNKSGVMEYLDDKIDWHLATYTPISESPYPPSSIGPHRKQSKLSLRQILSLLKASHPFNLTRVDIIERELEKARARVKELEILLSQEFKSLRVTVPVQ